MALDTSFVGAAKPLDAYDIPRMAHRISVTEDHFRAFFVVEAGGKAFDKSGRPTMLFEPHVFYRCLPKAKRRKAAEAGLAYQKWRPGEYPSDSYPRLLRAIQIDEDAALKACSIGLSQVLVENHLQVGYDSPQEMWQAFMDDEENHVEAMLKFLLANSIDDDLRAERWENVARVYNGPKYAQNNYHTKMAKAFRQFRAQPDVEWSPDAPDPSKLTLGDHDTVQRVQEKLIELGYPEAGKADGKWGTKTRAAVLAFRADRELPIVADIDDVLLSELMRASKRPVSEERATATAEDLRVAGSRKIAAADDTSAAGGILGACGGVGALGLLQGQVSAVDSLVSQLSGVIETVKPIWPFLLLALGAYIVWQQIKIKRATVQDYREGKYVGR